MRAVPRGHSFLNLCSPLNNAWLLGPGEILDLCKRSLLDLRFLLGWKQLHWSESHCLGKQLLNWNAFPYFEISIACFKRIEVLFWKLSSSEMEMLLFMGNLSFLKSTNTVFSRLTVYRNNWQMAIENTELKLGLQLVDMLTSVDFKRLLLCFI